MKENKITRFVMIGEKKNGKIRRNEQYSVGDFMHELHNLKQQYNKIEHIPQTLFNRIFNFRKITKEIRQVCYIVGQDMEHDIIHRNIHILIENDEFGKKCQKKNQKKKR